MLVSTFNATHQRQLEDQLENAQEQLLRQNVQLEASNKKLEAHQMQHLSPRHIALLPPMCGFWPFKNMCFRTTCKGMLTVLTRDCSREAQLEGQQAALKLRLKQALRLAKAPQTHVNTLTVADKAIALFDGLLEGEDLNVQEVIAVRNAMVVSTDLRQPMNLGDQLLHRSGLSNDVGQAMIDLLQEPEDVPCS
ncbi:hypothetical protein WJX74_004693 [Apatococcus lobatus]|uniref:Uncharacterized protein n=1 Tax=Apatococcus lobatus TaxID=904363 RepID=A0AAW1RXP9_9CHLO